MRDIVSKSFIVAVLAASSALAANSPEKLSTADQKLLAVTVAKQQGTVSLLIMTQPGWVAAVAGDILQLGGMMRYRDDNLGYMRVRISADKVREVAALEGVQALTLDRTVTYEDPRPKVQGGEAQVDPPGPTTPPENAYLPTRDIGAPQFLAAHPSWDGRKVTIGIVDSGVTLDHPSLQTTTTGEPKIVDWYAATDPLFDDDPTWINMRDQVQGATFAYRGVTYIAPQAGEYRIGLMDESDPRFIDSEYDPDPDPGSGCGDLNRDGNPPGSSRLFAVLWDTAKNTVWVDSNQNQSFADEPAMTDYKVRHDVGTLGKDDPATPVSEEVKFVVQTDGKEKCVNLGIIGGSHGSHVAGIAAGVGLFGSANGVAPGARIVSCRACLFHNECTWHGMLEGMIKVVKQSNVDVVNMSIGGLPALNDGQSFLDILYSRLADQYGAQLFLSAINAGPGINTVGFPSTGKNVVSVGASVHKDTWLANFGAEMTGKTEGLFTFSSRGPAEDGSLKPNLVAPGSAVSSIPMWMEGLPIPDTYPLPPGYGTYAGTSMAAPQSAGAAALLISAAKQSGVQCKPAQLRQALYSSPRFISGYGAHEQGTGLLQVGAAWEILRQKVKPVEISSLAPVNTVLSPYLQVPNMGPGLYEREGWTASQTGTRYVSLVRTSGGAKAIQYNLSWVGNDGTFSGPASVGLALNKPSMIAVSIQPPGTGVHSALLSVDDPTTPGVDYQMLMTVVVAAEFSTANDYTVTYNGTADRPDNSAFFFNVPPGVPAYQVSLTDVHGYVWLTSCHPYGVPFDYWVTFGEPFTRTLTFPMPGVWEADLETLYFSPVGPSTFRLTAALQGAKVTPSKWVIDAGAIGTPYEQEFTFENLFGAFTGGALGSQLGSASAARPNIANLTQFLQTAVVASGSTLFRARIGNPSDIGSDLDLYVFVEADGVPGLSAGDPLVGSSADGDAEEEVSVEPPSGGATYYAIVDAYSIPSGSTDFDYTDAFLNPVFGSVEIFDPVVTHGAGEIWTATASVTPLEIPGPSRFLQGFVEVQSGGAVLGRAEVQFHAAP